MAVVGMKRSRDLAAFKAKKRQRTDSDKGDSQVDPEDRAVGLDKLPWSQVSVDRLEDAEGFFGLEELSDVDIVRETTTGKIKYRVCSERDLKILTCRVLTAQCSFCPRNLQVEESNNLKFQMIMESLMRMNGKALATKTHGSKRTHQS